MPADSSRAVFLSYASQDAEAARRICDALRAVGVEVWFDQSELRGGDAWDAKIRKQIKECALLVPVISANTQARLEGYFRLEWHLAERRMQHMHEDAPFLLPVVIDGDISEDNARVPAKFLEVQWTKLPGGETPAAFGQRVRSLLEGGPSANAAARVNGGAREPEPTCRPARARRARLPRWATVAFMIVGVAVGLAFALGPLFRRDARPAAGPGTTSTIPAPAPTSPEAQRLADRAFAQSTKLAFTREDLQVAEDYTRKATELEPGSSRAWAIRAWVQAAYINRTWDNSERRRQEAEAFAKRALAIDENEAEALYALGVVMRQQGAFAQAESLLRKGLGLKPQNSYLARGLASAVISQGRTDEGREILREALRREPRDALSHYDLASSYANPRAGDLTPPDLDQAFRHLEASLAIQPFASAMVQKALLLAAWRDDQAGMRAVLEQMNALPPADRGEDRSVFTAMWGALLERNSAGVRTAGAGTARTYFEDGLVARPKAWMTALALQIEGKESLARFEWTAAERVLQERLRAQPQALRERAQLAATLAWLGRTTEAMEVIAPLEAAYRDADPGGRRGPLAQIGGSLAQYHAALGDAAAAVRYLRPLVDRQTFFTRHVLRRDAWWDKLRGQPEFEALLAAASTNGGGQSTVETPGLNR